jgi:hypothetical protein
VITNLPETVPISEDTTTTKTLFTVVTSDDNTADTYTCAIVNTMSVEPFYLDRDPPVSGGENKAYTSMFRKYMESKNQKNTLCKDIKS